MFQPAKPYASIRIEDGDLANIPVPSSMPARILAFVYALNQAGAERGNATFDRVMSGDDALAPRPDMAADIAAIYCDTFQIDPAGRKYVRIVSIGSHGGGPSGLINGVHCFVDATTGDVYKAAGWTGPAKGARYNLASDADFAFLMWVLDQPEWAYGGYLYADKAAALRNRYSREIVAAKNAEQR